MKNPFRKRYWVIITTHGTPFLLDLQAPVQTEGHKFWQRRSAEQHGKAVARNLALLGFYSTYEIKELP